MVTLKKIKLNNFLSHKESELTFKENQKLLISGDSGSGKSSIVEAIIWCLYGKGRVENKNIIKRGAKFATVVLELESDEKFYRIERSVTLTGKHTLDIGEKKTKAYVPMKHVGLRDAQEWVEKSLLKSSYTLFINSVAYPQDNIENFVKQTAIKRKELLLEIADTENYDELYENARKKLADISDECQKILITNSEIDINISRKEELVKILPDLEISLVISDAALSSWQGKITEAKASENYVKETRNQLMSNALMVSSLVSRISQGKETVKQKTQKVKELSAVDDKVIEDAKNRLSIVRESLKTLKELQKVDSENNFKRQAIIGSKRPQSDYSAVLRRLEGQLMDILLSTDAFCEHLGKDCPKLEQERKNKSTFIEDQIKDIKERMENQSVESANYERDLAAVPLPRLSEEDNKRIRDLETEELTLSFYDKQGGAKEEREKTIDYLNSEIIVIEKSLVALEKELESLKNTNKLLEEEVRSISFTSPLAIEMEMDKEKNNNLSIKFKIENAKTAEGDIKRLKEEKTKLEVDNKKIIVDKECLELAKEAFGSKGIKTVIIDYLIPRLEYRINEILSKMSDFKIRLETQKEKADGDGSTEGLFINIYNEAGESFPLANYSGGQKLKITVAISEALAFMQKSGFRIFDEVFLGLDENSIGGFNEVMHSLQDKFSQVLCISHLQTIKDSFEEKITVVKEGDNSKIYEK